jgi:hypothetical protein
MISEMLVWWDELITKHLPLDPLMSKDVFMRYPKECLLEWKQRLTCVSDPPNKLAIKGTTKPLGSQRVGHESRHLRVTWLEHLVMPPRTKRCRFQHVLLHLKE